MIDFDIIENLGLEKAVSVISEPNQVSESQLGVINQVKDFGIDEIYFSTDDNHNSYPAVFLKEVQKFDDLVLREIATAQKKIWNFKKVIFLYVYSETEIRIYNCAEKPLLIKSNDFDYNKELKKLEIESYKFSDKNKLKELQNLFSTIAIDTGIIWTLKEAVEIRKKISLKRRVDKYLVDSLTYTAKQLQDDGLEINLIHKIIMRSLFLLYLEDRGATDAKFYSGIKEGAQSYFDILDDEDKTYSLYRKLEEYFNGNVFTVDNNETISREHLQIIKKCFINGNDDSQKQNLFEDFRLFDFSIIQIELLSEIYENFLSEINPTLKQDTGTYYTPPSLVELILNEKLPIARSEKNFNIKILDPTCGSGIFLVESFKRLVKRHENATSKKLTDFNELKKLLTDNIFGIEIHPQSIKVAAFSLYLALVDNLNPKTIWQNKDYRLPYLINDPSDGSLVEQGNNLFRSDTIKSNPEVEAIKFDLVVGNPPFGTKKLSQAIRDYSDKYGFAKEMVLPFLHKATTFSENGEIALIFNTKILTNTKITYQNFRKWLFNECYVEKIYNFSILRNAPKDFGGQLFGSATGPISIVFYRKNAPNKKTDTIVYYAPKTYIKSNVIEGVSIDGTDLKYLPREECKNPTSKIWKIAMWGGNGDMKLIHKLNSLDSLEQFISDEKFDRGSGLQYLNDSTKNPKVDTEIPNRYIAPKNIRRYASNSFSDLNSGLSLKSKEIYAKHYGVSVSDIPTIDVFRRVGAKKTYFAPHILIKEGLSNWKICASYENEDCSFNSKVLGVSHSDANLLKGLTCFINSKLAYYYLFLCSASIGIEREEIKPNEVYKLPFSLSKENLYYLAEIYDRMCSESEILNNSLKEQEKQIDEYIFKCFNFSKDENLIVDSFVEFTIPLLIKRYQYVLGPTNLQDIQDYAVKVSEYLNDFLQNQNLYANCTIFVKVNHFSPLMITKVTFEDTEKAVLKSIVPIDDILKVLDKELWKKKATNIYFRKKLNYKTGNDIFIIRPNQKRFWTQSMAIEDASELILEILNEV
ncbi:N-6 DNA methylase [Aequorivita sp. KMM 9714]|uniref:HsdM family class I SAM-dependent methyltransferase n=1 Tax=Aequorivita sp. KMM 9714 TaxID=2707173 RepID=UPI0013EA283B|nr:N-6 DNA methylase [Aequorivita sp. KMM 9714]NGX82713.1 N-6 DNA methylase [Aequorivita sp. KMM 9714]